MLGPLEVPAAAPDAPGFAPEAAGFAADPLDDAAAGASAGDVAAMPTANIIADTTAPMAKGGKDLAGIEIRVKCAIKLAAKSHGCKDLE